MSFYDSVVSCENFNNSDDCEYHLLISKRCKYSTQLLQYLQEKDMQECFNIIIFENSPDFISEMRKVDIIIDRVPTLVIQKSLFNASTGSFEYELFKKTDDELMEFLTSHSKGFFINNSDMFDKICTSSKKEEDESDIQKKYNEQMLQIEKLKTKNKK